MPAPAKRTKLQRLVAALDKFHGALVNVPGDSADAFIANWKDMRSSYVDGLHGVRPSQLAAGLEQGLREMPMLFEAIEQSQRGAFAEAFHSAIQSELPEFHLLQEQRLSKILDRGRIRSEAEFLLVRHAIDVAETRLTRAEYLARLYQVADEFESNGAHVV